MKQRRSKKEERSHSLSSFFKLIVSSSQTKRLRIPKESAKKLLHHGISHNAGAILKVPTGETRKVELVEEDNELWFRDGWLDFVEYFSIKFGYFLLFKYQGKSNFNVHIFDLSACEIHYPYNNANVNNDEVDDQNEEPKIIQIDSDDDIDDDDEHDVNQVKEGNSNGFPVWLEKYEGLLRAVSSAGISLPENPFFVAPIKSYVLHKGRYLNIPIPFGERHIGRQTKVIKLEADDGKQWQVKCVCSKKYSLNGGWIFFAREIGLEVGDICLFELTDAKNYVFKVHVAKNSEICVVDD